jgi:glutathione S-transferase
MTLILHIGNKNYSTWSLRGWLAMKATGAPFEERLHQLHVPDSEERLGAFSPSRRVPCLEHDGLTVWDSLAIVEYLAETFPAAGLWPAARDARAVARSVSAEMHSGFEALRSQLPMNVRADKRGKEMTPAVVDEIARVRAIWRDCRARFGRGGPFLFGAFGAADCMFAPVVVGRFRPYGVALDGVEAEYAAAVWEHPFVVEWVAAARREPWAVEEYDRI